jgi:lipid-A-disaccharide synthase
MKIAFGIGELSGDLIASSLIKHIKIKYPNVKIIGITGPNSQKAGLESKFNISDLSKRGFFEVLFNLLELLKFKKKFIDFLDREKPDIYIGVDAPDFNFPIEKVLKKKNIKVYHFVCPSVWAWRSKRIKEFKKTFDHLFCIFNHEKSYLFSKNFKNNTFVGHPLAKNIPLNTNKSSSRKKLQINHKGKVIALMPGSRSSEVIWNTEVLLEASKILSKKLPNLLFLIPITTKENLNFIQKKIFDLNIDLRNIKLIYGHSHDVLKASDFAAIASGTATIEAVFFKTPMVIFYKMSLLSYLIFKMLLRSKFIGLPNIISNQQIAKELIYHKASANNISDEILKLIENKNLQKKLKFEFTKLHKKHSLDTNAMICKKIFK